MQTIEVLKQFVAEELVRESSLEGLDENQSLLESGIIDSMGILLLVSFIEEKFKIKIEAEDLIPENFNSLNSITCMISIIKNNSASHG